jgi:hypothetical protein
MAGNIGALHLFANDVGPEPLSLLDGNFNPLLAALNTLAVFSNYYVDAGAVNAMAVTLGTQQILLAYVDGLVLQVQVANTTTTTTPSLNVNGLGAKTLVNPDGSALSSGSITAGSYIQVIYDASLNSFIVLTGQRGLPGGLSGNAAGQWAIAAPSSGSALTVAGAANAASITINTPATSGQSFGLTCNGGTTAADWSAIFRDQAGNNIFQIRGDHAVLLTDNAASPALFQAGYMDAPVNNQAAGYTLVISDRGKTINKSSGVASTWTIPANASVAFPIGTVIILSVNSGANPITLAITTDTLAWAPTNTTGSRTLSNACVATLIKIQSTLWLISGVGIS